MSAELPPVLVCRDAQSLPEAAGSLTVAGWVVRIGFALPDEPWDLARRRWACQGSVAGDSDAKAATWALVRGCALIVAIDAGTPPDFLEDVRRAGQLEQFSVDAATAALSPVERALLTALAAGQSIQQAAAALYLSDRTAQRRIASARAALNVGTTREAVVAWTQLQS